VSKKSKDDIVKIKLTIEFENNTEKKRPTEIDAPLKRRINAYADTTAPIPGEI